MSSLPVFRQRLTISERETDQLGHVNNVVWLKLVMRLAEQHSTAVGMPFSEYARTGGHLVVRRHEIDYCLPAFPGDELLGETWLSLMHGARSIRHARFLRVRDGAVLLESTSHWAYVDAVKQRPRRIPRDVAARFTLLDAPPEPGSDDCDSTTT